MVDGKALDRRVFLSLLPAGPGERRLALGIVAVSVLAFLICVPFAKVPLGRVDAFIPAYQSALAINDLITAALLFGQFSILRSRALLVLAGAYLFTALMIIAHTLSFPGLFSPTGLLGAGPQTTAWLYFFWHGGFPLLVSCYALLGRSNGEVDKAQEPASAGVDRAAFADMAVAVMAVGAVVIGLTLIATRGAGMLPAVMIENHYSPSMLGVVSAVWILSPIAMAFLWRRRPHSVLDLWLMVVMCAWMFDIGLSAVFNAGRFDLGFYAGRVYGLMAASFVLLVLLLETRALYVRLAQSREIARAAAELRAEEAQAANRALQEKEERLRQLNETLELRVAERSRQLESEIAERERAQEALRETQKLEAIGRMAGGVAHDFNNLLTIIQGNAELLEERLQLEADRQAIAAINRATDRGAKLIRQILAFSRRQSLKAEVLDLRSRADDLAGMLERSVRGDIRVMVRMAADLAPVECDVGELELALMNLCVNARDAMPKGGVVQLDGRNAILAPDRDGETGLAGDFVALSLIDAGTGIAPENLKRVFEPFFTTKDVGKGTGLGLSQVYGFSQQSGGTVTVESKLGHGTSVTIYLPRAAATTALGEKPAEDGHLRPPGTGMVLLVEDDDDVAKVTMNMLDAVGYQARHVQDAGTALSLLLGGQRFDLLLSDIVMPGGMNGLDLARKVRQHFPRLPILLVSGYARATAEVYQEGFDIIAKPFSVDTLAQALQRALDAARRQTRNLG